MTRRQRIVLVAYAVVLLFVCVVVPWEGQVYSRYEAKLTGPANAIGYSPIWHPPRASGDYVRRIDFGRLGIEIFLMSAVAGVAYILTSKATEAGPTGGAEGFKPER